MTDAALTTAQRTLLNRLQDGIPLAPRPFAGLAAELGVREDDIVAEIEAWLDDGTLTRFGPMYRADTLGGGLALAALAVPEARFDEVAAMLDAMPEVAHNYAREHELNMWFVLAVERPDEIASAAAAIEAVTGLGVYLFPKEQEYFVDLRFPV